jgi:hypothetical protein
MCRQRRNYYCSSGLIVALLGATSCDVRGQRRGHERRLPPQLDGRTLTFRATGDAFEDRETRSRWTLDGRAVAGPLAGRRLTSVPHGDYF